MFPQTVSELSFYLADIFADTSVTVGIYADVLFAHTAYHKYRVIQDAKGGFILYTNDIRIGKLYCDRIASYITWRIGQDMTSLYKK